MTTLNVAATHDYRADLLLSVTVIDFTNPTRTSATATFLASQFDNTHILDGVTISGSVGINTLRVVGSVINPDWVFTDWTASDKVQLIGTAGDDLIWNAAVACLMDGGAGNDSLTSYSGDHTILGGLGDDSISAHQGVVDGGDGVDLLYGFFTSQNLAVNIDLTGGGLGLDIGNGMTIAGIERASMTLSDLADSFTGGGLLDSVYGGLGNDTLRGQGGGDFLIGMEDDDLILGGAGNDLCSGYWGNDITRGGDGNDTVAGDIGDDQLYGDKGADVVWGGGGRDRLTGGGGADRFTFFAASDSGTGAARDVITDFQQGLDRIDLSHIGVGQFQFIGATSFYGPDMEVRSLQTATDTIVQGCIDPTFHPDVVFEIRLSGLFNLAAGDFIL